MRRSVAPVLVVTRFDVPEDEAGAFLPQAQAALAAFAARPGYLRGRVGRAADDPRAAHLGVYHWLTFVQDSLVQTRMAIRG